MFRFRKSVPIRWILPFFAFAAGYFLMHSFLFTHEISTPNVVGKQLSDAISELSENRLGVRLLHQIEDATHPEGTILDQLPKPAQKIRYNQQVFLTLSTKQKPMEVPDFWGKTVVDAHTSAEQKGFELAVVPVAHTYPEHLVIGQDQSSGEVFTEKKLKIYTSKGQGQQAIMPCLKGAKLKELEAFFKTYDIRAEIYHSTGYIHDHDCTECLVVAQLPAKGTIVDMARTLHVQLQLDPELT